jgi:hypothetical protein
MANCLTKQHAIIHACLLICVLTSAGCGLFEPHRLTQFDYPDVAFSPDGDWIYFVMRQTAVLDSHDASCPGDSACRTGLIQKDSVWLKRVRVADGQVESLREWTPESVGRRYAVIKTNPVTTKAGLAWMTGRELAFWIDLEISGPENWRQVLSGVWSADTGKIANFASGFNFPENARAARLHGELEAITTGRADSGAVIRSAAILVYDRSVPSATSYAVSPPGKFIPYEISLLLHAIGMSRRERIEFQAARLLDRSVADCLTCIAVVARVLTPNQVTHLRNAKALTTVYQGTEARFTAEVRELLRRAVDSPGSVVASSPNANAGWFEDVLYIRDANRFLELRRIN